MNAGLEARKNDPLWEGITDWFSLRHALHIDGEVVALLAEGINPLPEFGQRGKAGVVDARALAPDAPRVRMPAARLAEPAVPLLLLAVALQELAEPEHGLSGRHVFRERGQVGPGAFRGQGVHALRPAPDPVLHGIEVGRLGVSGEPGH